MQLNLGFHQRQISSTIEASTERRNPASNFVKNDLYYSGSDTVDFENMLNKENTEEDLTVTYTNISSHGR
jgi:hypothetical protein